MSDFEKLLKPALIANQFELSADKIAALANYLELMSTWNKAFNLTSITEPRDMVYLHIIDSLTVQPFLHGERLLDVGSGAGLPGIPLAIVNPNQQWVLLDKNSKKTRFQTQAIAELGLKNIAAVHDRCEDFQPAQGFDSILSRAFSTLRTFVETTEHLLAPTGIFIAMKGKYPQEELDDLPGHFVAQSSKRLAIKGVDVERHVICLRKNQE